MDHFKYYYVAYHIITATALKMYLTEYTLQLSKSGDILEVSLVMKFVLFP
jgi:hypothetical protein